MPSGSSTPSSRSSTSSGRRPSTTSPRSSRSTTRHGVGDTTNYTYGINNRFYAKRGAVRAGRAWRRKSSASSWCRPTTPSPLASRYDAIPTSFGVAAAEQLLANLAERSGHAEPVDRRHRASGVRQPAPELRTLSANTGYNWTGRVQTQLTWTKRSTLPSSVASTNRNNAQSLHLSVCRPTPTRCDNRDGLNYAVNYDILRSGMLAATDFGVLQRAVLWSRLYQTYNYAGLYRSHSVRSSILSLVHPRRSRQLLAVQWRLERRPALTLSSHMQTTALVTGAAGSPAVT